MSWGGTANIARMDYADCVEALSRARHRENGKPIGTIRIFDRGSHYAVQQYSTDIVRYYEDGSMEITTGWNASNSTRNAIWSLTRVSISNTKLPTFNGRRPDTETYHEVQGYVCKGVDGYLRIDKDGKVDPESVKPIDVEIITDPKALRLLQRHAKAIDLQLKLRRKLGVPGVKWGNSMAWLSSQLHLPLDEINYAYEPDVLGLDSINPFWFAKIVGATKTIKFKEFP